MNFGSVEKGCKFDLMKDRKRVWWEVYSKSCVDFWLMVKDGMFKFFDRFYSDMLARVCWRSKSSKSLSKFSWMNFINEDFSGLIKES
jgi:hypothetical protein